MMEPKDPDAWEMIHRYTRAQAIEDGILIDVSTAAREAGFRYPVAISAAAHAYCVAVPDTASWQDEAGRLWDVLNMLRFAIANQRHESSLCMFELLVQNAPHPPPQLVKLKSVCGPGDEGEPVITIMLPDED